MRPTSLSTNPLRVIGSTGLLLSLTACGGGGSSSSTTLPPVTPPSYQMTLLVADQASAGAVTTDTHLVNPWGLAYGPSTGFWVANQGTATTTVYDGAGKPPAPPLVVSTPAIVGAALGGPTGVAFNGTTGFLGDSFILASLDGSISGWSTGTATTRRVDNSASQAVYTGLTTGTVGAATYLYAANLNSGAIDVFDSTYTPVSLGASALVDPTLPAGFVPYNVQVLGGKLYVTYAKRVAPALRETTGAGLGYVSSFNLDGSFDRRVASTGLLNAPWGLALAPTSFGPYGGALLVGNFGDGRITAYNASTGAQMGQVSGANGTPLALSGLWGMTFGNGGLAGNANYLYVTAGPQAETHGSFAVISYGSLGTGGSGGGLGY
jgi:uncharacterized protein (TIGR03118 family)